jgi:VIT1/CCC1 family predicted Fe2+/Mn2+ transporter
VAAIGCNIAWGFVDGVMYVLRNLVTRGRQARLVRALRGSLRPEQAHRLIGDEIGALSGALGTADLERVRQWVVARPAHDAKAVGMTGRDLRGAVSVFLLVFLSTFPVVLPFVFIADPGTAKRVSAAVAIAMLFLCGFAWGRYADVKPWRTGLIMVLLGLTIEAVVIALGG